MSDAGESGMDDDGRRRQQVAAATLRGLYLPAPPRLVAAVEAERAAARRRVGLRRVAFWTHGDRKGAGLRLGLAAAVCIAAALFLVPLFTSGGGTPTVVAAAQLAERLPTHTSPPPDPVEPTLFQLRTAGVPFPDFAAKFGWRAVGWRADEFDGRPNKTVTYVRGEKLVGYTILAGAPLPPPAGSRAVTREGTRLHISHDGSRQIVTWLRDGRTCVISATDVGTEELLTLASWTGKGTVPF
jgi:hypothetical protein